MSPFGGPRKLIKLTLLAGVCTAYNRQYNVLYIQVHFQCNRPVILGRFDTIPKKTRLESLIAKIILLEKKWPFFQMSLTGLLNFEQNGNLTKFHHGQDLVSMPKKFMWWTYYHSSEICTFAPLVVMMLR